VNSYSAGGTPADNDSAAAKKIFTAPNNQLVGLKSTNLIDKYNRYCILRKKESRIFFNLRRRHGPLKKAPVKGDFFVNWN
jgi:hypothetical protein